MSPPVLSPPVSNPVRLANSRTGGIRGAATDHTGIISAMVGHGLSALENHPRERPTANGFTKLRGPMGMPLNQDPVAPLLVYPSIGSETCPCNANSPTDIRKAVRTIRTFGQSPSPIRSDSIAANIVISSPALRAGEAKPGSSKQTCCREFLNGFGPRQENHPLDQSTNLTLHVQRNPVQPS